MGVLRSVLLYSTLTRGPGRVGWGISEQKKKKLMSVEN